jgi:translation elongation factor EF-Tu-like GTPase
VIYSVPLLPLIVLFESSRRKPIFGIYRPQAYIKGAKGYCSVIRFELFKKEVMPGDQVVVPAVLEAPVGFGKKLRPGVLLTIKDGLDEVGKAIVLEIGSSEVSSSLK